MLGMLDRVSEDIKTAMKSKDKETLDAVRMLKARLIENKTSPKPQEEMEVVIAHVKKIKDSLELFPDTSEQKTKLLREIEILQIYMPEQLDEAKVKGLITSIVEEHRDGINLGVVMRHLTPQIKGKFDGKRASELVKEALGS